MRAAVEARPTARRAVEANKSAKAFRKLGFDVPDVRVENVNGEFVYMDDKDATNTVNVTRIFNKGFARTIKAVSDEENHIKRFLKGFALGYGAVIAIKLLVALAKQIVTLFTTMLGIPVKVFRKQRKTEVQSNIPVRIKQPKLVSANHPQLQSGDVTVVSNVYANTYKMSVELQNCGEYYFGQVCFIDGTLAVQPEHFTAEMMRLHREGAVTDASQITFTNAVNPRFNFTMLVCNYSVLPRHTVAENDVDFIDFCIGGVRAHRNITNNFITEEDIDWLNGVSARLDICDALVVKQALELEHKVYCLPKITVHSNLRFNNRRLDRYFMYSAPTASGDCGAPLSLVDNTSFSGRTVLGFHVAGQVSRGVGLGSIVTQKMIEVARGKLKTIKDDFLPDLTNRGIVLQCGDFKVFPEMGSFLSIGKLEKPVSISPKSKYFLNPGYYGVFGEYDYLPAPLRPVFRNGEMVYPMVNAVAPFQTQVYPLIDKDFKQAMHVAFSRHELFTKGRYRGVYTFEEAVCGVPQEKFRSLPRNTAPGFPYCYDFKDGKKSFLGSGEKYDLTNENIEALRARVDEIIDAAKRGVRLAHVFLDFLKDELRSHEKVEAVKTRLISCAPMDYTIAWRRYFGAFSAATMHVHTKSGMAPGISCFTNWDQLADMLQRVGFKVFDGDFKGFDASEQPTILQLMLDYVNRWYDDGEENALVRRVLWEDMVHSRHVGGDGTDQRYIYQWNKSLPSGHPFTTIVNSMYSLFAIVLCYIKITKDRTGFWENVSAVTYGDDNAVNPSDGVADIFNQVTLSEAMWKYLKLVYTSGRKTGELEEYTDLDKITFLKRRIVFSDGHWLAPLELDSFLYTIYWSKNKKRRLKIVYDELENALEELSMHDQAVWDKYAAKLGSLIADLDKVTKCPLERDQYLAHVLTRADSWY